MNIRRSTLPAKASTRSIILASVMLIGIFLLACGSFGGTNILIGLGLIVVLSGAVPEVVFGLLGQSLKSNLTRRHM